MSSSFLIAYPDIPPSALVATSSAAFDVDYPLENAYYGDRSALIRLSADASSVTMTFDLGTGNSRTIDHFIIGDVQRIYSFGVTEARVQGSSNGSTWTDQLGTVANFQTRTFSGPNSRDVIFTAAFNDTIAGTLSAYRYWRVSLAGGTHRFSLSKLYFGAFFDMGKEPDATGVEVLESDSDAIRFPRGHVIMTKDSFDRHRITIEWDGVTDAKVAEWSSKILSNAYRNLVFLYTTTYLDPLFSKTLIHARVVEEECTAEQTTQDWWNVVATFEELV